ncbi:hypothetical protein [Streptomyces sp. NPDC051561]|uniref:hypothetical protein n=1 Tax=Streptomyces sp. NPDC051561 TaxID=3365658 RepID=UPI0037BA2122
MSSTSPAPLSDRSTAPRATGAQRLNDVERSARAHDVPLEDALLIAINLFGISSDHAERHRARVNLRLVRRPEVVWQIIVPLNRPASPFRLRGDALWLDGRVVAHVEQVAADEAVGGYFRNDGRAATLNPNARSRCVGCGYCPNTLEAAQDPRMGESEGLDELLHALAEQHPHGDLRELADVTVSTGCFEREEAALAHLTELRGALDRAGIRPTIGFLTSVLRSNRAMEMLASEVAPFTLRLTVECFTRRAAVNKASKASLEPAQMPGLLARAAGRGLGTSFTLIVGLDPLEDMRDGVASLAGEVSCFPNFQVFQAHNLMMAGLRVPGAETLDYYLAARQILEGLMKPSGLRPVGWECYRPLWFYSYAGEELA